MIIGWDWWTMNVCFLPLPPGVRMDVLLYCIFWAGGITPPKWTTSDKISQNKQRNTFLWEPWNREGSNRQFVYTCNVQPFYFYSYRLPFKNARLSALLNTRNLRDVKDEERWEILIEYKRESLRSWLFYTCIDSVYEVQHTFRNRQVNGSFY